LTFWSRPALAVGGLLGGGGGPVLSKELKRFSLLLVAVFFDKSVSKSAPDNILDLT